MVGGRSREPRSQYCRPGKPAIANHQTRHEVHNQVSRRRAMLLMQGTEVPEHRRGYLQKKNRLLGRRHHEKKQDDPTRKNQHQEHRSQKHQPSKTSDSHQQAKPSATRAFFVWPDIPHVGAGKRCPRPLGNKAELFKMETPNKPFRLSPVSVLPRAKTFSKKKREVEGTIMTLRDLQSPPKDTPKILIRPSRTGTE